MQKFHSFAASKIKKSVVAHKWKRWKRERKTVDTWKLTYFLDMFPLYLLRLGNTAKRVPSLDKVKEGSFNYGRPFEITKRTLVKTVEISNGNVCGGSKIFLKYKCVRIRNLSFFGYLLHARARSGWHTHTNFKSCGFISSVKHDLHYDMYHDDNMFYTWSKYQIE